MNRPHDRPAAKSGSKADPLNAARRGVPWPRELICCWDDGYFDGSPWRQRSPLPRVPRRRWHCARAHGSTLPRTTTRCWTGGPARSALFSLPELETYLTASATFESWDFRWAYVVRYVEDYRLTIDQRTKLLEKALDETRIRHEFFVALYGGERRYNDITKPESAWIVRLVDNTGKRNRSPGDRRHPAAQRHRAELLSVQQAVPSGVSDSVPTSQL